MKDYPELRLIFSFTAGNFTAEFAEEALRAAEVAGLKILSPF